jgi:histidine ammonia-lyase
MSQLLLDHNTLSAEQISDAIHHHYKIEISPSSWDKVKRNREFLDQKLSQQDVVIYGINTGFGSLCNVRISDENLGKLQENLVLSHACGMGELVPEEICRTIHLLKIINLSHGYSGVRPELLNKLIKLYNAGITPVIFQQGSLGASGDLAPLAHLSLMLLGKGQVYVNGKITDTNQALLEKGIDKIDLKSKEGLALLNGTQFSLAYATEIITKGQKLLDLSNKIAAMSMDAYVCDIAPFDHLLHDVRPHLGQRTVAQTIYSYLESSGIRNLQRQSVQDPYSFRCVPQVHGASLTAILHAKDVIDTEINSVTDNPIVFDEADKVLSGGNFHAQPLALILDYLAIALSELGSISERRVYQLINGDRGLPAFLTKYPGLDSGFMIAQYTAASIASQNKQYCTPASVDSIVSSKGQEDHVSMAANAATKCYKVLQNLISLLAIELLTAAQAMEFRRPAVSSPEIEAMITELRAHVPMLEEDRLMHDDMKFAENLIKKWIS